jgi:SAM-dependent methyltransferase
LSKSAKKFYDRLSPYFRDNIGYDWEEGMRWEGEFLYRFLAEQLGDRQPKAVLDCSCGIGTQAIGLALHGHQVHGTDLSPVSIDCARQEAARFGIDVNFGVADFRKLGKTVSNTFDVVISCDNSFAHCLHDDDLAAALASIKSRLKPGGLLLISIRDYDALIADKPIFNSECVQDTPDGRRVAFQVWDWASDGHRYGVNQFLLTEKDGGYEVKHFKSKLRALLRDEIMTAVGAAGYGEAHWHDPEISGYYQPIVTARKE